MQKEDILNVILNVSAQPAQPAFERCERNPFKEIASNFTLSLALEHSKLGGCFYYIFIKHLRSGKSFHFQPVWSHHLKEYIKSLLKRWYKIYMYRWLCRL